MLNKNIRIKRIQRRSNVFCVQRIRDVKKFHIGEKKVILVLTMEFSCNSSSGRRFD